MTKDRDGNLWFGTDGAGVCCVDSIWNIRTTLSTKSGANALRQNNIKALAYHPGSNRLFIGTHLGGLSVYDITTGTTTNMIDNPQLARELGNVIHSLKVRGDNLFIASRTGLSRIDLSTDSIHHIPTPTPPCLSTSTQPAISTISIREGAGYTGWPTLSNPRPRLCRCRD